MKFTFKSNQNIDNTENEITIALAGNPNVGKSSVFNQLTGMKQHTGNWIGKTVSNAVGECYYNSHRYIMVDIPGTYSLSAHSAEEEVARDYICFGDADTIVVVCDAGNLERNINLVLQIIEIFPKTVVCLNLMDEAKLRNITIDVKKLEKILGVPVVAVSAKQNKGLKNILEKVDLLTSKKFIPSPIKIDYPEPITKAIDNIVPVLKNILNEKISPGFIALKLLEEDYEFIKSVENNLSVNITSNQELTELVNSERNKLLDIGLDSERIKDRVVSHIYLTSEKICNQTISFGTDKYRMRQLKIDKILTGKWTGVPIMLLLLAGIFWLTISGANYPSQLLSNLLFKLGGYIKLLLENLKVHPTIISMLIDGVYRVLAWVVSVMLPPMAIFFPLFTLFEDLGYLPRVAFNMDNTLKKCNACGKQSLTMCIVSA